MEEIGEFWLFDSWDYSCSVWVSITGCTDEFRVIFFYLDDGEVDNHLSDVEVIELEGKIGLQLQLNKQKSETICDDTDITSSINSIILEALVVEATLLGYLQSHPYFLYFRHSHNQDPYAKENEWKAIYNFCYSMILSIYWRATMVSPECTRPPSCGHLTASTTKESGACM